MAQEEFKYRYFVSYYHSTIGSHGFGHCQILRKYPVKTMDDVRALSDYISEEWIEGDDKKVIILNWKRLADG